MLEINTKAPDFTLQDSNGKEVSLHNFKGKKVVIYFYPKDNTPGCTKQACAFFPWQNAYYPLNRLHEDQITPWMEAFVNARVWIENNK